MVITLHSTQMLTPNNQTLDIYRRIEELNRNESYGLELPITKEIVKCKLYNMWAPYSIDDFIVRKKNNLSFSLRFDYQIKHREIIYGTCESYIEYNLLTNQTKLIVSDGTNTYVYENLSDFYQSSEFSFDETQITEISAVLEAVGLYEITYVSGSLNCRNEFCVCVYSTSYDIKTFICRSGIKKAFLPVKNEVNYLVMKPIDRRIISKKENISTLVVSSTPLYKINSFYGELNLTTKNLPDAINKRFHFIQYIPPPNTYYSQFGLINASLVFLNTTTNYTFAHNHRDIYFPGNNSLFIEDVFGDRYNATFEISFRSV